MSKSPSLRRIQADIRELALDPSDRYHAAPLESDMFEWHFTIRGADGTDFEGGIYHGRILLPPEYPFKPPHIVLLTPSGRFQTNTKVCLSFSAYHPELWQPAWGIRLILEALISFLPTPADGAVGALDWTPKERKRLAGMSVNYVCKTCGKTADLLRTITPARKEKEKSRFQKEIEQLHMLQVQEHTQDEQADGEAKKEAAEEEAKEPALEDAKEKAPEQATPTEPAESAEPAQDASDDSVPALLEREEAQPLLQREQVRVQAPVPVVPAPRAPAAIQNQQHQQVQHQQVQRQPEHLHHDEDSSWLVDPVIQGSIAVLATICFLLLRKVSALLDDLRALGE